MAQEAKERAHSSDGEPEYYFISDLHIGGDGPLDECDFEDDLVAFLRDLEHHPGNAELVILGDAFGLWEYTEKQGLDKLRTLVQSHGALFEQFRKTGARVRITLIAGNHDHELACYPEYVPFLKEYGVDLQQEEAITRPLAGRRIWIEHGNQHDNFNAFKQFGDPAATPIGYYVTTQFVSGAGLHSKLGRQDWLKDLQAVYPTEHIPDWVFSNYFYREMSLWLRFLLLPFLLLFGVSVVVVLVSLAEKAGLLPASLSALRFFGDTSLIGKALEVVITANSTVISFLLMMAVPLFFIYRDVKATLERYRLIGSEEIVADKKSEYDADARRVFAAHPDVIAYVYGHTHKVSLKRDGPRAIINTGTWLKKLTRLRSRFRLIPDVYASSYCLNYFRLYETQGNVAVVYHRIPKASVPDLTFLQRLAILWRRPAEHEDIPELTILESEGRAGHKG